MNIFTHFDTARQIELLALSQDNDDDDLDDIVRWELDIMFPGSSSQGE